MKEKTTKNNNKKLQFASVMFVDGENMQVSPGHLQVSPNVRFQVLGIWLEQLTSHLSPCLANKFWNGEKERVLGAEDVKIT